MGICNPKKAPPAGTGEPVGSLEFRGAGCCNMCCAPYAFVPSLCPCGPPCGPKRPKGAAKAALADPAVKALLAEVAGLQEEGPKDCCGGPDFKGMKRVLEEEGGWLARVNSALAERGHALVADLHFYWQATQYGAVPMLHLRFFERAEGGGAPVASYGAVETGPARA